MNTIQLWVVELTARGCERMVVVGDDEKLATQIEREWLREWLREYPADTVGCWDLMLPE